MSRREIKQSNAEIAFLGMEGADHRIELTWRGKTDYSEGDQLDHLAFEVKELSPLVECFRDKGVEIAKEPYSLGPVSSRIPFIKDPNGI